MIEKETVMILGAGASAHLNFALGTELVEDIVRLIFGNSTGVKKIKDASGGRVVQHAINNSVLLEKFLELSKQTKADGKKYTSKDIEKFGQSLFHAQPPSIDFYLQKNPQYALLGKLAIVLCLSRHEDKDSWQNAPYKYPHRLYEEFPRFGWYKYLWDSLSCECDKYEDFKKNKVTIITYNYDRSLENYLINAIQNYFNVSEADAAEAFNTIKIYHVYGKLGKFYWEVNYLEDSSDKTPDGIMMETNDFTPWEPRVLFRLMSSENDSVEYGMSEDDFNPSRNVLSYENKTKIVDRFNAAAKGIMTFCEATSGHNKDIFSDAIRKAERVYFLGFGFQIENIKILGTLSKEELNQGKSLLRDTAKIYGTAYSKSYSEVDKIIYKFHNLWFVPISDIKITNKWLGCDSEDIISCFMREIAPLV
ncbi:MAG: hypothetical protein WC486_00160 [Candidatus Omnitrophota bacterium]